MADVKIDIAAEFTGNKAFKQAETTTQKLEKSVAKLGKQLLGVFAAGKLLSFGKQSVKAFAADEKAARSLTLALANTGNAFAAIEVEKFIGDLQRATGVLDDQLRPAFRTLLTATGNVKKSQDGLALALDIAAGTGKDLGAVSMALAKAYGGQTTALSRLGAGLSKATLASGDLDLITSELTKKFSGQALAAAEGYAGSMAKLAVASENAKEIIGKDLLDSMQLIAGKDGIGGATTAMEGFATEVGNAIYGVGVLISKLKQLPGGKDLAQGFSDVFSFNIFGLLSKIGSSSKARLAGTPAQSPGQRKAIDKANADALRLQKQQNSLKTIDNNATARKIALTGDELALKELEKKFDVERVGLYAALNQSTSEETKLRLLSLIAIHDQNAAMAGMIKKANEAENAFAAFIEALRATIRGMLDAVAPQVKQLQTLTGPSTPLNVQREVVRNQLDLAMPDISALQSRLAQYGASSGGASVVVNVQGSVTTERDLVNAITQGIYNNQASGIPISYSTAYR
jgi:peptidoglycan hydrolase-like protein with peptidoglycan-binding domain